MKEKRSKERPQDITKDDISEYQSRVYAERRIKDRRVLSASSRSGKIKAVKNFFRYLSKEGIIGYNPTADIELPRWRRHTVREVLSESEAVKLLEAAGGQTPLQKRDRAILEIFYSTGIRNSELRGLEMDDINLDRQEIRIRNGKGYFGKRERLLPLGSVAAGYLEEYMVEARPLLAENTKSEYVFVSFRGKKLGPYKPSKIVREYARRAGLTKKACAHTLRHTCATHLLRGGADIRYVQEMLGHSSLESTVIYTRVEISDLKKVYRKTHPREKV